MNALMPKATITNIALAKKLLLLTVPITLTFTFILLSSTIDTIFSSQYDPVTLAALSIASVIGLLPLAVVNGIMYTAVPQYSYLKEQNKTDEIFNLIIEYFIIALILGTAMSLLFILCVPYVLSHIGIDAAIIEPVKTYLKFLLPFILGMVAFNNFYYFSESYGFPAFATLAVCLSLGVKGFVIYLLVFSDWVQHSWGITGFGLAAVVFAWAKVVILLPLLFRYPKFKIIWHQPMQRLNLSYQRMLRNSKKGIPISLSSLSQWGSLMIMGMMIARLGVNEVGANAIIYSIMPISLVIVTALSRAIAILVAQYQDQKTRLKQTLLVGTAIATGLLLLICMALVVFSTQIVQLYRPNEALWLMIQQIYPYMVAIVFLLGLSHVFGFALKGFSDFLMVFVIAFVTTWLLFIPLGYVLSSTDFLYPARGIVGWWHSLLLSTMVATILFYVRLYHIVKRRPDTDAC